MIEQLPGYITAVFILTTLATLGFVYAAIKRSGNGIKSSLPVKVLIGVLAWLTLQSLLALGKVYQPNVNVFPPKIMLFGILPAILVILFLFLTVNGRRFLDSLPLYLLTFLHIIRIPVELVLFWLFLHKAIPQIMTFEGRNFDIIAGITAPFIAYFGLSKKLNSKGLFLTWHFLCLALLLHIMTLAFLSTPSPMQQLSFDQPNTAILYFPFVWLPTFIVPVVLLAHLSAIRQLFKTPAYK